MGVKMNLRIITKNDAADPEIGFLTKSISKPYGRATAMPPAWELKKFCPSSYCSDFETARLNALILNPDDTG